ncbi:MAG: hypothetical protein K1X88_20745 [Nannocystaceae bacterium]|nr:hypothetical protein [Nannocystaceae bacterium]
MVIAAALVLLAAAAPSPTRGTADPRERARMGGEFIIDAGESLRPPSKRKVHGHAGLSTAFGVVAEDPAAAIEPSVALDLRAVAPVRLGFAVPLRLRLVDRDPGDAGVLRRRDWDEVGDYFAVVRQVQYRDDLPVRARANVHVAIDAGVQRDATLGHGSLLRGYANGLDLDRRRTGLRSAVEVSGPLLRQPAAAGVELLAGDLAGSQVLGARAAARWAGAGLGVSVVGDPTAPRRLVVDASDPAAYETTRGNRLATAGARGVVAGALELEYRATDRWRWSAGPYLDLDAIGSAGRGLHLGGTADGRLGARRGARLGATAELTVGSRGYDPAYFDVFYTLQRWSAPLLGPAGTIPATAATTDAAKLPWVRANVPAGVGGMGEVRFEHSRGATARFEYRMRPGALGHTAALVVGVDVPQVSLFARFAHRGNRHGFEPRAAGTLAQLQLRVPALRWLDVVLDAGYVFAIRRDRRDGGGAGSLPAGAGLVTAGVGGVIPW